MSDRSGVSRRRFLGATAAVTSAGLVASSSIAAAAEGNAEQNGASIDLSRTGDRVWLGPALWANPMEDWKVAGGRIECISKGPDRNVHLLTHELSGRAEPFRMSVRLGFIERGEHASAGFRFGVHDTINDYRGNCFFGEGWKAGVGADRTLFAGAQSAPLGEGADLAELALELVVEPRGEKHTVTLTARTPAGEPVGEVTTTINAAPAHLLGNVALVNNFDPKRPGGRCWFNDWKVAGDKFDRHADRAWGPILWAMHTLSDSRSAEGFVLKMTAQLPPMGAEDPKHVALHVQRDGKWIELAKQDIMADSCTATFRVARWDAAIDTPYRLTCGEHTREGTVRKNPIGKPLVVGNLTCQFDRAFPYAPIAMNLATLDPDMLFFSGDQLYEPNGGYGIIRNPADRAILNYLRKWYMFGWAFGGVMRDRPTVCLPDDHDVFHGNIWGEDGKVAKDPGGADGGYLQPAAMVQVVHRTQCSHHPDLFDPTPVKQGISVYYGDMVYGRVSFAILGDRQFKSAPHHVETGKGRPDWVEDAGFDVEKLDKPGLVLLGERQHKFLDHWVGDWRGADMKVVLSQTVFANAATHHGNADNYLLADLDSGGWPQTQRDRAVRSIRRAFPVHLNGDQHLTTLLQHGADEPRDAFWSFSAPAICCIYQRWWRPDRVKRRGENPPAHGLPNTGDFRDGFGNLIYMYAVGNPAGTGQASPTRYAWSEDRAGGFGVLRVDRTARTYAFESYRFSVDLAKSTDNTQFPGFPHTIHQRDNYARKTTGKLPAIRFDRVAQPVLKVIDQQTGELVYAIRLTEQSVEPWVYSAGDYTVQLGDPDTDTWTTHKDQKPT